MRVLVTGGAGFIGSHAAKRLLADGHEVTILDAVLPGRGHEGSIAALRRWAGPRAARLGFVRCDAGNSDLVEQAMITARTEAVMHFAAVAYVGESVEKPLEYHGNNARAMLGVLDACLRLRVARFVFSSSCAVYGAPIDDRPMGEDHPQSPINPYGWTKVHGERLLLDAAAEMERRGAPFACCALRYFNAAGADSEGVLGEVHDPETHLIPAVLRAAAGLSGAVAIHGDNYPTPDGTCVRDFVHVEDIVDAHVRALHTMDPGRRDRWTFNLGSGRGSSVREVVAECERITGRRIAATTGPRRPGDPARLVADARLISERLEWRAERSRLDVMVSGAWEWLRRNPGGYA